MNPMHDTMAPRDSLYMVLFMLIETDASTPTAAVATRDPREVVMTLGEMSERPAASIDARKPIRSTTPNGLRTLEAISRILPLRILFRFTRLTPKLGGTSTRLRDIMRRV